MKSVTIRDIKNEIIVKVLRNKNGTTDLIRSVDFHDYYTIDVRDDEGKKLFFNQRKMKWTGKYRCMVGPNGTIMRWSGSCWIIRSEDGKLVSRHDSRAYALKKARKIDKEVKKNERN